MSTRPLGSAWWILARPILPRRIYAVLPHESTDIIKRSRFDQRLLGAHSDRPLHVPAHLWTHYNSPSPNPRGPLPLPPSPLFVHHHFLFCYQSDPSLFSSCFFSSVSFSTIELISLSLRLSLSFSIALLLSLFLCPVLRC